MDTRSVVDVVPYRRGVAKDKEMFYHLVLLLLLLLLFALLIRTT